MIPGLKAGDKLAFAFTYQMPNAQGAIESLAFLVIHFLSCCSDACKTGTILETIAPSTGGAGVEEEKERLQAFAPEGQFSPEKLAQMEQLVRLLFFLCF